MFSEKEMIAILVTFHKLHGNCSEEIRDTFIEDHITKWAKKKEQAGSTVKKDGPTMYQFVCTKCGKVVESPTLNPPRNIIAWINRMSAAILLLSPVKR